MCCVFPRAREGAGVYTPYILQPGICIPFLTWCSRRMTLAKTCFSAPPPKSSVDNIPGSVPHSSIRLEQPLFVKRTTSLPRCVTNKSCKCAMYCWSHCSKEPYSFSTYKNNTYKNRRKLKQPLFWRRKRRKHNGMTQRFSVYSQYICRKLSIKGSLLIEVLLVIFSF